MLVCMYVCMSVCKCVSTYVFMYVCMHARRRYPDTTPLIPDFTGSALSLSTRLRLAFPGRVVSSIHLREPLGFGAYKGSVGFRGLGLRDGVWSLGLGIQAVEVWGLGVRA